MGKSAAILKLELVLTEWSRSYFALALVTLEYIEPYVMKRQTIFQPICQLILVLADTSSELSVYLLADLSADFVARRDSSCFMK